MIIQCTSKVVLSWRVAPANSDGNEAPIHISSKRPTHPVWSASQPQQGNPNHQTHVPRQPNHTREGKESVWHVILFKEPNPTGSRPSDLIRLYYKEIGNHGNHTYGTVFYVKNPYSNTAKQQKRGVLKTK